MSLLNDLTNLKRRAITKSDSTVYDPPLKGIIVTAAGTLTLVGPDNVSTAIEIPDAAGGARFPFTLPGRISKVMNTGTDMANSALTGLS